MKVLIATENGTPDSAVAKRFGHAPYYLVFDTQKMQMQIINNHNHDDSHKIIRQARKYGVEIFITGNMGPQAFAIARSLNFRIALARKITAKEALEKLHRNELKFLDAPTLKQSVHENREH